MSNPADFDTWLDEAEREAYDLIERQYTEASTALGAHRVTRHAPDASGSESAGAAQESAPADKPSQGEAGENAGEADAV